MTSTNRLLSARVLGSLLGLLVTAGCIGDRVPGLDGGSSTGDPAPGSSTSSTSETSGSSTTSTANASTTEAADGTTSPETTSPETTSNMFLAVPDVAEDHDCDFFDQDCPPGHKCMPWAEEGDDTWYDTRCRPVAEDPVGIGERCHVEGWSTSGIDDCESRAMCRIEDLETNEGQCIPFCLGSWDHPVCEDPDRACDSVGHIPLCVPVCDPLQQDCADGELCIPLGPLWYCVPEGSGDLGAHGDPCEFIDQCDLGLICLASSLQPPGLPCEGVGFCCTEICDLSDPAGDSQCTGAAEGQVCQAWYEAGTAPPGYENIGVCALPQ